MKLLFFGFALGVFLPCAAFCQYDLDDGRSNEVHSQEPLMDPSKTALSESIANPGAGLRIEHIEKGSVYEKIGLKEGDVIKKWNGTPVVNADQLKKLLSDASASKAGKKVSILIDRAGKEQIFHYTSVK